MTDTQFKMLSILDRQISSCKKCSLYQNGRAKPFWSAQSINIIIGEAPGRDEIINSTPFIGRAGKVLWDVLHNHRLSREQFLIINSANCRPVNGNKNGKPTSNEMIACSDWVRKYIKVLNPNKILLLGSYAVQSVLSESVKITVANGTVTHLSYDNETRYPVVRSVHPAYTLYSPNGKMDLEKAIGVFARL
jgi:uracil-DNA glycosylase